MDCPSIHTNIWKVWSLEILFFPSTCIGKRELLYFQLLYIMYRPSCDYFSMKLYYLRKNYFYFIFTWSSTNMRWTALYRIFSNCMISLVFSSMIIYYVRFNSIFIVCVSRKHTSCYIRAPWYSLKESHILLFINCMFCL